MPYTNSPSTDTGDAIRLLIGDTSTSSTDVIFTDSEIDYFDGLKPNAYLSAAVALNSIVGSTRADRWRSVVSKRVGDLQLDYQGGANSDVLRARIRQLRSDGVRGVKPYAGGISISDKDAAESDTDWNEPSFKIGQFSNPATSTGGAGDYD